MADTKKVVGACFALALVLVGAKVGLATLNAKDDKTLISEAVEEAIKASKDGRSGGVMDFLSTKLKFNNTELETGRGEVAKFIKNSKPEFEFSSLTPQIFSTNARIETSAKMKVGILNFKQTVDIPKVIIHLEKEEDREWLIIPHRTWRITNIEAEIDSTLGALQGM